MRIEFHGIGFALTDTCRVPVEEYAASSRQGDFSVSATSVAAEQTAAHWIGGQAVHESGVVVALVARGVALSGYFNTPTRLTAEWVAYRIAEGYLQWKQELWTRLQGEFALCVWDPNAQELSLVCDPLNSIPLYFAWSPHRVLHFGIHLGKVARSASRLTQLDLDWIASAIVVMPPKPGTTCFRDVATVPSGCAVTVKSDMHAVARYWRPLPFQDLSNDDLVSSFRARVQARLSDVAATQRKLCFALSGGLDSSSLLCAAAHNGSRNISAVTHSTPNDPASYELDYARVAAEWAGIPLHIEEATASFDINKVLAIASAPHVIYWCPLIAAVAQRANVLGADCLITGSFGDIVGGFDQGAKRRLWRQIGRGLKGLWSLRSALPQSYSAVQVARLWLRSAWPELGAAYDRTRMSLSPTIFGIAPPGAQSRRDDALVLRMFCRESLWSSPDNHLEHIFHDCVAWEMTMLQGLARTLEQFTGVPLIMPFCDPVLIRISASIPWDLRCGPEGNRVLERRAFAGIVPEAIRLRQTKCHFNTFFSEYYSRSLQSDDFIAGGRLIQEAFDRPWDDLRLQAVDGPFAALRTAFRAGVIGAWLRRQGLQS